MPASKLQNTHTTGNLRGIRDWINVRILIGILNNSFAKHYHWRKLDKGHIGFLGTVLILLLTLHCTVVSQESICCEALLDSSENPRIRLGSTWRREFTRLCLLIPLSCPSTAHTEQNKTRVLTRMETSVCGESHKSKMLCFKYDLNGVHGWSCNPQCVDLSG